MPNVNTLSSFMEVSFGVNIMLSSYAGFRDLGQEFLSKYIVEKKLAWVHSQEIDHSEETNELQQYSILKSSVEEFDKKCRRIQSFLCRSARIVSLLASIACILVLFFGICEKLGIKCGYFILSWPVYFFTSVAVWFWYGWKISSDVRQFKKFKEKYSLPPEMPPKDEISRVFKIK